MDQSECGLAIPFQKLLRQNAARPKQFRHFSFASQKNSTSVTGSLVPMSGKALGNTTSSIAMSTAVVKSKLTLLPERGVAGDEVIGEGHGVLAFHKGVEVAVLEGVLLLLAFEGGKEEGGAVDAHMGCPAGSSGLKGGFPVVFLELGDNGVKPPIGGGGQNSFLVCEMLASEVILPH